MDNNVLVICATLGGATDQVAKFGKYMSYVTLICLGVSVICLLLHVVATFISPGNILGFYQLQWGSEYRTSPHIEWRKVFGMSNGPGI